MNEEQPFKPAPVPTDLNSIVSLHSYVASINNPTEEMIKCKDHLEKQISKIIHTIEVQIVRAQVQ